MPNLKEYYGVTRSLIMYYGIPFRRKKMVDLYGAFVSSGGTVFDCGSHVGNRIRAFRDLGAQVIGIEPQDHLMKLLQRWYGNDPHVVLEQCGVGSKPGLGTMLTSSKTPTVTTFSAEWIDLVRKDKRFQNINWDDTAEVPLKTLDQLIAQHGIPDFCKIDVEGFEYEVLQGLSYPLKALSFEYIPVAKSEALRCLDYLDGLGSYSYNWSLVETMKFQEEDWVCSGRMKTILNDMPIEQGSGDIYAKLLP